MPVSGKRRPNSRESARKFRKRRARDNQRAKEQAMRSKGGKQRRFGPPTFHL